MPPVVDDPPPVVVDPPVSGLSGAGKGSEVGTTGLTTMGVSSVEPELFTMSLRFCMTSYVK